MIAHIFAPGFDGMTNLFLNVLKPNHGHQFIQRLIGLTKFGFAILTIIFGVGLQMLNDRIRPWLACCRILWRLRYLGLAGRSPRLLRLLRPRDRFRLDGLASVLQLFLTLAQGILSIVVVSELPQDTVLC
jgi:hypothetical protein